MSKIQQFINNRHKYKVDTTYQRPADAWSSEDNQCLIDTILRDEPMPIYFLNYISNENVYYIVDGQQRLYAISKFYDNKIKLNKKLIIARRIKMSFIPHGSHFWIEGTCRVGLAHPNPYEGGI